MTRKVLLVENDRTVLKHLARVLKRLGLECDTAEDYPSADRLIINHATEPYLLHTIDIELGGHIGLDLIDKHKTVLTRENTAIITTWGRSYEARLRELDYPTLDKSDPALNIADADRKLEVLFSFFCSIPSLKKVGILPPSSKT